MLRITNIELPPLSHYYHGVMAPDLPCCSYKFPSTVPEASSSGLVALTTICLNHFPTVSQLSSGLFCNNYSKLCPNVTTTALMLGKRQTLNFIKEHNWASGRSTKLSGCTLNELNVMAKSETAISTNRFLYLEPAFQAPFLDQLQKDKGSDHLVSSSHWRKG